MFAGANMVAAIWYSIFQVRAFLLTLLITKILFKIVVKANILTLPQLCYIWTSLGFLLLLSSFLFLDWTFSTLNLPYRFDTKLEHLSKEIPSNS